MCFWVNYFKMDDNGKPESSTHLFLLGSYDFIFWKRNSLTCPKWVLLNTWLIRIMNQTIGKGGEVVTNPCHIKRNERRSLRLWICLVLCCALLFGRPFSYANQDLFSKRPVWIPHVCDRCPSGVNINTHKGDVYVNGVLGNRSLQGGYYGNHDIGSTIVLQAQPLLLLPLHNRMIRL